MRHRDTQPERFRQVDEIQAPRARGPRDRGIGDGHRVAPAGGGVEVGGDRETEWTEQRRRTGEVADRQSSQPGAGVDTFGGGGRGIGLGFGHAGRHRGDGRGWIEGHEDSSDSVSHSSSSSGQRRRAWRGSRCARPRSPWADSQPIPLAEQSCPHSRRAGFSDS